jgi:hypothetical protein
LLEQDVSSVGFVTSPVPQSTHLLVAVTYFSKQSPYGGLHFKSSNLVNVALQSQVFCAATKSVE